MKTDVFVRHACVNTVITISKREQIFFFLLFNFTTALAGDFAYDIFLFLDFHKREC